MEKKPSKNSPAGRRHPQGVLAFGGMCFNFGCTLPCTLPICNILVFLLEDSILDPPLPPLPIDFSSFSSPFFLHFSTFFRLIFRIDFWTYFWTFFGRFWGQFWTYFPLCLHPFSGMYFAYFLLEPFSEIC